MTPRWFLTHLPRALVSCALIAACSSSDPGTVADVDGGRDAAATDCAAALVTLQTAQDPTCAGGNEHRWPVGLAPGACHGWRSTDTSGRVHENSASAIGCNADGSFQFTQYAGNLTCAGSGVTKRYAADACTQDTPPNLYTVAVDLTCCTDPTSPACAVGVPSATVPGTTIYLDGLACPG
ncbi:MAG: hypothetical protein IPL61_24490 [Myxococcales bacterium]|nr:hypothetical protein [Myxococcales bacterium]